MRRPREEEQADWWAEDGEERRFKPRFLCAQAILLDVGDEPEVEIPGISGHTD